MTSNIGSLVITNTYYSLAVPQLKREKNTVVKVHKLFIFAKYQQMYCFIHCKNSYFLLKK